MKKVNRVSLSALLLAALLLLGLAVPGALAAPVEGPCALTLTFAPEDLPAEGVGFQIYRVATVNQEKVTFTPLPSCEKYRNILQSTAPWLTRASTLKGHVQADGLTPTAVAQTDGEGVVTFSDLDQGLYLILADRYQRDGHIYTPTPCFLSLPNSYDGGQTWTPNVEAVMKSERSEVPTAPVERHVLIVWDDAGHESVRPASVTVDLLRDGAVYDTMVLGAGENWRCDWTGLDPASEWTLIQRDPGERYTVTAVQREITTVITNTYRAEEPKPPVTPSPTPTDDGGDDDPETSSSPRPSPSARPSAQPSPAPSAEPSAAPSPAPSAPASSEAPGTLPPEEEDLEDNDIPLSDLVNDPDISSQPSDEEDLTDPDVPLVTLPQTGQLWWPVPLLAILGLFLILCGLIRRRAGEAWDELE